jgi:hypothetical protein
MYKIQKYSLQARNAICNSCSATLQLSELLFFCRQRIYIKTPQNLKWSEEFHLNVSWICSSDKVPTDVRCSSFCKS